MAGPSGIDTNELQTETRYLIRQPRALQWFENGRLVKRRDEERQAGKQNCRPISDQTRNKISENSLSI
jgi:hypothetical protein